ncbi:serine/arginine repetitive matrix protein 1-like isoform X2 [Lineus longissimus]|uniref:serine/arginine repetitive matrix protein 1-like isoform X2 n=1 Tax=Lineus longissimus TaxID=88925 RepID=UPI002B4D9104
MMQSRSKVFVGNLLDSVKKDEIKRLFGRFGHLRKVWLAHNPPGFAFIEFFNHMDAKNCVRNLDGKPFSGSKIRVELSYSDGPKPGNQVNMKGKLLPQKGRPQNGMNRNHDNNNMQMRRNGNSRVNGFGNGVFKHQMRNRNFDNGFDDVGMNFRGNMNFRKRNGFSDNGTFYRERDEQRGYKYGALDCEDRMESRKRNNSHPDEYRRRDPRYVRDPSDEPVKRPRSPESEGERQVKYARYSLEQQNGHRNNHAVYIKDTPRNGNTDKWNGVHNGNLSGNSVSSSDGGNSTNGSPEYASTSPVERRRKHKRKEVEATSPPQRRRSPSPIDLSESEVDETPLPHKKSHRRKHNSSKRNGHSHESRTSGSDRSHSGRPSSPEITFYKSRHHDSDSSPEVRLKLQNSPNHRKRNGRRSRHTGATNGRRTSRLGQHDTSPRRRLEDLPQQYQPTNGGVNGYDCSLDQKNDRSQYNSLPSDDEQADWSKKVDDSPERKPTNHTRQYDLSPECSKHTTRTKCNSPPEKRSNDQSKQYDSSPEKISERNKRPRSKKR